LDWAAKLWCLYLNTVNSLHGFMLSDELNSCGVESTGILVAEKVAGNNTVTHPRNFLGGLILMDVSAFLRL
jgi:hypothetical protein